MTNPLELLELSGVGPEEADAIVRFRVQHGPIRDLAQLAGILGSAAGLQSLADQVDFAPAEVTAPEAPGA